MKDSEGRQYDGWCLKYPEDWGGRLATYTFETTRAKLWEEWVGVPIPGMTRASEIKKYGRAGFRAVKVTVREVKE